MEQVKKSVQKREEDEEVALETPGKNEKAEKLKADMDAVLDEIDGVLEENAEEFIGQYVQKGGE